MTNTIPFTKKALASSILLWMRTDQPRQQGMEHWKGPHSKIISASPGLDEDRQLHLEATNPGMWPATHGVETGIPADRKVDGVAEVTFASAFKTGTTPRVVVDLTGSAPTGSGTMPKHTISSVSATGFTVNFTTLTGGTSADNYSGADMTGTINFVYHAVGLVDEPA